MSNISIFRANMSSDFDPPDSATIGPFTASTDTLGYYDNNLYRWTPAFSGFYLLYVITFWRYTSTDHHNTYICKNGSALVDSTCRVGISTYSHSISTFCIGKTDGNSYFDARFRTNNSSARVTTESMFQGIFIPDNYWKVKIGR